MPLLTCKLGNICDTKMRILFLEIWSDMVDEEHVCRLWLLNFLPNNIWLRLLGLLHLDILLILLGLAAFLLVILGGTLGSLALDGIAGR